MFEALVSSDIYGGGFVCLTFIVERLRPAGCSCQIAYQHGGPKSAAAPKSGGDLCAEACVTLPCGVNAALDCAATTANVNSRKP
jgi:hypothetical protein